ncbi:transporter substrate-binding domain-containing protein [Bartonella vinsonii]|uniref:ABC transporter, periplasmic amino acid-binding protein n=1 Tax=Bartonella vinsonii subsp. berkhoffii str. Tweed TaxID=1094502 RepID=N6UZ83_BARVB|nr:transporter substrate-binding domain-containing protein [Bartonella vinsonii]AGF75196.1 ABC transporter, periplasmic amino acid-binding protein [Bartonella vinsonii subsp. berkhoffii str. Winnie]ENN95388.1 ABC transporter, periplasmic amino acid-binding protein [Bartonella vinsonii subsp. berkhoffii str. Tweed]
MKTRKLIKGFHVLIGVFCVAWGFLFFSFAEAKTAGGLPSFFASHEHLLPPDTTGIIRLRFVTTFDFPPFNFLDKTGYLAGYHIDLLRAICSKLNLEKLCEVEVVPWEELVEHVKDGGAEVIIAGLKETSKTHQDLVFTKSYLRFPARFVASRLVNFDEPISDKLTYLSSGVLFKSAHEKLFRNYFPEAQWQAFKDRAELYKALQDHKIDLIFDDGFALSLWLNDPKSNDCCYFVGGAYMGPQLLGQGMRLAVAKKNDKLIDILNYALKSLENDGKLAELYLRYFPMSFY